MVKIEFRNNKINEIWAGPNSVKGSKLEGKLIQVKKLMVNRSGLM